jgi:aryl-alcohol dehydrogenase-like predicted oxidoreductase
LQTLSSYFCATPKVKGRALPEWAGEIGCSSWAQVFLKFVLAEPAVTVVIPAASKPNNMADNLAAGSGAMPDARQRERIAALLA